MATDITISHYATGTATVAANGTNVVGQGTAWLGAVRPGDLFGTHVGLPIRILSVNSNVSLTLAHPWPGAAQAAAAYEIHRTPYDVGYRQAIEDLVTGISDGNLPLLAALAGAADKIPYFDSDNSMALANFPAWARSMLSQPGAADKIPYLTGANGAALTTLTSFGRSLLDDANAATARQTLGTAYEVGSNVNGTYVRYADGTLLCTVVWDQTLVAWDAPSGALFMGPLILWSYPANYITEPVILGGTSRPSTEVRGADSRNITPSAANIVPWSTNSIPSGGVTKSVHVVAIGRWF